MDVGGLSRGESGFSEGPSCGDSTHANANLDACAAYIHTNTCPSYTVTYTDIGTTNTTSPTAATSTVTHTNIGTTSTTSPTYTDIGTTLNNKIGNMGRPL